MLSIRHDIWAQFSLCHPLLTLFLKNNCRRRHWLHCSSDLVYEIRRCLNSVNLAKPRLLLSIKFRWLISFPNAVCLSASLKLLEYSLKILILLRSVKSLSSWLSIVKFHLFDCFENMVVGPCFAHYLHFFFECIGNEFLFTSSCNPLLQNFFLRWLDSRLRRLTHCVCSELLFTLGHLWSTQRWPFLLDCDYSRSLWMMNITFIVHKVSGVNPLSQLSHSVVALSRVGPGFWAQNPSLWKGAFKLSLRDVHP